MTPSRLQSAMPDSARTLAPAGSGRRAPLVALRFPASPTEVRGALMRLAAEWEVAGLAEEDRGNAELVLAEVLNNVVEHACKPGGAIAVSARLKAGTLAVTVCDGGVEMPGTLPDGTPPSLDGADLPEGGYGWHLIRTLASNLSYQRISGWNCLYFQVPMPSAAEQSTPVEGIVSIERTKPE